MTVQYQEQGTFLGWWDLEGLVGLLLECADQLNAYNEGGAYLTNLVERTRIMANTLSPQITERLSNEL